jgi:hypothetical protein
VSSYCTAFSYKPILNNDDSLDLTHLKESPHRVLKFPPVYSDKITNNQAYYDKLNISCSSGDNSDVSSSDEAYDRQSMDDHVYMRQHDDDELTRSPSRVSFLNHSLKVKEPVNVESVVKSETSISSQIRTVLELNSNQIFIGMVSTQYKAKIVK